tara:strand:+ start:262 stop:624 length:363 start_codon:yes stop_codon:yes gene_type:complete
MTEGQLRSNEKEMGKKLSHFSGYGSSNKLRLNSTTTELETLWIANWESHDEFNDDSNARLYLLLNSMVKCCIHPATLIVDIVTFDDYKHAKYTARRGLAAKVSLLLKAELALQQLMEGNE